MATNDDLVDQYDQLRAGDSQAVNALWNRYYDRLVRIARRKLNGVRRRAFDEEDVAVSALRCFFEEAQAGRFYPWQTDRELWQLLFTITARKAFAYRQRELRERRGGGRVRGDSVFRPDDSHGAATIPRRQVRGAGRSPEQMNLLAEEADQLLESLADESLQRVARLRLAGYTNDEIADQLGCVRRTVERKLERIRSKWLGNASCG